MARWVLDLIREEILEKECPDFVLMNKEDMVFLLELIACGDELYKTLYALESFGNARKHSTILDRWRSLLSHDA